MVDSNLTDKIRRLLAMAEHPNSNEYEAAIAMQKAQALLLENNLSQADIKTGNTPVATPGIGKLDVTEEVGFTWKRYLLHTLAINSLCHTVSSCSTNTSHVFGAYENVKGVVEMYNWLCPELERHAMRAWLRYQEDGTGHESAKAWKHGFFMGATSVIGKKLQESMGEFAAGPGKALVLYNNQLVKDAVKRVFPYTVSSRASSRSYDGLAAGRAAGSRINLRPQRQLKGVLALGQGRA